MVFYVLRDHDLRSCCYRGSDSGEGGNKKPTARFASAVGWKLFLALLGVSPLAGSGRNRLSRSRDRRHRRRRAGNSLSGDGESHTIKQTSMGGIGDQAKK